MYVKGALGLLVFLSVAIEEAPYTPYMKGFCSPSKYSRPLKFYYHIFIPDKDLKRDCYGNSGLALSSHITLDHLFPEQPPFYLGSLSYTSTLKVRKVRNTLEKRLDV